MTYWDDKRVMLYMKRHGTPQHPTKRTMDRMKYAARHQKGTTVLDVGCGVGHLYPWIKDLVKEYVGLDASPYMLTCAREFFPEVKWIEGDAHDLSKLPLFDTVYSMSLLMHMWNVKQIITQMWEHTKQRCIFNIPLRRNDKIVHKTSNMIWHHTSFKKLKGIIKDLPGEFTHRIVRYNNIWYMIRAVFSDHLIHYFVIIDRTEEVSC